MPAKIETLKCNAAEILVEPAQFAVLPPLPLLHRVFLFFVFLTDVLFVLQKAKRPGWSLSHCQPPPHIPHTFPHGVARHGKARLCRLRIARCERTPLAAGKKSIELARPQTTTLWQHCQPSRGDTRCNKDTHTSAGSAVSDSLCISRIIRTFSSPKYPIHFVSYMSCIIAY